MYGLYTGLVNKMIAIIDLCLEEICIGVLTLVAHHFVAALANMALGWRQVLLYFMRLH